MTRLHLTICKHGDALTIEIPLDDLPNSQQGRRSGSPSKTTPNPPQCDSVGRQAAVRNDPQTQAALGAVPSED